MAMLRAKKTLSKALAAVFTAFTLLSFAPANAAAVAKPTVLTVSQQPAQQYKVGDRITFKVHSNYGGAVEYRVILWNGTTKTQKELWAGTPGYYYQNWKPSGNFEFPITWVVTPDMQPGAYSLTVLTRQAGSKASYDAFNKLNTFWVADNAPVAEATIASLTNPADATVNEGTAFTAPSTVKATMSDNTTKDVAVAWDKTVDTTKAGDVTLTGKVAGTDKTVSMKVSVKEVALQVQSVSAINKDQVKVTFNYDLGTVSDSNVVVYEKGNEYATIDVDKVEVNGKSAVITLLNSMEDDEDYTLSLKDVTAKDGSHKVTATKDFAYNQKNAVDAASITFKATTVAAGDDVEYVIKDKDGNDITSDFTTADLTIETSNEDVVSADLVAGDVDATTYAVVNVKVDGTDLETGNTIITVKTSLAKLTKIDRMTLTEDVDSPDYAKPTSTLYLDSDKTYFLVGEVEDQDGDAFAVPDGGLSFKSNTPSVAVVDATTGEVTPVAEGTATLVMTAEKGSTKVSKSFSVTVKKAKEASKLEVNKSSVKVVMTPEGNEVIDQKVKVTLFDQYGKEMDFADDADVQVKVSKLGVASELTKEYATTGVEIVDGKAEITITPYAEDADGAIKGTATVTVQFKNDDVTLTKTFTVTSVEADTFAGFAAVADDTKLDVMDSESDDWDDLHQGPKEEQIKVYEKDVNGNYINMASDVTFESDDEDIATVSEDGLVTPVDDGTANITVKVGGATIAKIKFTVVDSTRKPTTITQSKTTITVKDTADLLEKLYTGKDAALKAVDQYGETYDLQASDISAFTSNEAVIAVDNDADTMEVTPADSDKTVTLTLKINKKIFTVTVKVQAE